MKIFHSLTGALLLSLVLTIFPQKASATSQSSVPLFRGAMASENGYSCTPECSGSYNVSTHKMWERNIYDPFMIRYQNNPYHIRYFQRYWMDKSVPSKMQRKPGSLRGIWQQREEGFTDTRDSWSHGLGSLESDLAGVRTKLRLRKNQHYR